MQLAEEVAVAQQRRALVPAHIAQPTTPPPLKAAGNPSILANLIVTQPYRAAKPTESGESSARVPARGSWPIAAQGVRVFKLSTACTGGASPFIRCAIAL